MGRWTKETALSELQTLIGLIPLLARDRRLSSQHVEWTARTQTFLEEVFGSKSIYYRTFQQLPWRYVGTTIIGGWNDPEGSVNPGKAIEREHQRAFVEQLGMADGLLKAAMRELERGDLEQVNKGYDPSTESNKLLQIMNLIERGLRKTIRKVPERETTVQDAFENLLIGADIPYTREAESIQYSSKRYRPDFAIPVLGLALEIKLCDRAEREKEIIAEINDDILAYQKKFPNLIFVVYDVGHIRDTAQFADSFETQKNVVVKVVKH